MRPGDSRSALALGVALLGCAPAPESPAEAEPVPTSALTPGLVLGGGAFATDEDHLVELVVHEGHVYVANSSLGVAAMSLDPSGGLTLTDVGSDYDDYHRCTSLALHAPSDTLYCGSDAPYGPDPVRVEIYDLSTPGRAVWRGRFEVEKLATRDLEVVGDRLLIHHFDEGLWTAQIDGEGELSQLSEAPVEGNVRVSVGVGDRVVSLLGDTEAEGAELRLLEAGSLVELDRLPLRGPPLGLSADAEGHARVGVGLGSGGMAIVALGGDAHDALVLERSIEPPAVVTSGLVAGDLAVAVTLSGAFAYELDLDDPEHAPRMFGFGPAGKLGFSRAGNMLHGLIHEGEVLTSDWLWVERWAIDRRGEVLGLDTPRGIYLQPEGPVRWRMRNPGEVELRAELWAHREPFWSAELGPGELVEVDLPADLRAEILPPDEPSVSVSVRVYDPEVPSEGEPLSAQVIVLAQRQVDQTLPPATGDVFPTVTLEDIEHQVYTMPTPAGSQTIWYWADCAMMWPQLEDLAWLERAGWDLGRGDPIFLVPSDVAADGFDHRWGLEGGVFGMWGAAAPSVGDANDYLDEEDIYRPFFIQELPGDAMPTDYVMDGEGVIRSIERMYRGPWTLVVPWPWPAKG